MQKESVIMAESLNYKASDTSGELARLMCLTQIIHNENMSLFKLFMGKKSDEIIKSYNKQFQKVLEMDFYSDNNATTEQ